MPPSTQSAPTVQSPAVQHVLRDLDRFLCFSDNVLDCRLCFMEYLLQDSERDLHQQMTRRDSSSASSASSSRPSTTTTRKSAQRLRTTEDLARDHQSTPYVRREWMSLYALRGEANTPSGYLNHCANVDPVIEGSVSRLLWSDPKSLVEERIGDNDEGEERQKGGGEIEDGGDGGDGGGEMNVKEDIDDHDTAGDTVENTTVENPSTNDPALFGHLYQSFPTTPPYELPTPLPLTESSTFDRHALDTDQFILLRRLQFNRSTLELLRIVTYAPWHAELEQAIHQWRASLRKQIKWLPKTPLPSSSAPPTATPLRSQLHQWTTTLHSYLPLLQHTRPGSVFYRFAYTLQVYLYTYNQVLWYMLHGGGELSTPTFQRSQRPQLPQRSQHPTQPRTNTATDYRAIADTYTKTLHTPTDNSPTAVSPAVYIHRLLRLQRQVLRATSSSPPTTPFREHQIHNTPTLVGFGPDHPRLRMVLMDNALPSNHSLSSSFGGALIAYASVLKGFGPMTIQTACLPSGRTRSTKRSRDSPTLPTLPQASTARAKWTSWTTQSASGHTVVVRPVLTGKWTDHTSTPTPFTCSLHNTLFLHQFFQLLNLPPTPSPSTDTNTNTHMDSDIEQWHVMRYHTQLDPDASAIHSKSLNALYSLPVLKRVSGRRNRVKRRGSTTLRRGSRTQRRRRRKGEMG